MLTLFMTAGDKLRCGHSTQLLVMVDFTFVLEIVSLSLPDEGHGT